MHGQSRDAALLQNFRDAHRVDGISIPTNSNFCCNGQRRDRSHYRFGHAAEGGAIFQQSGAAIFRDHFVNRAPEIQINEIGGNPIHHLLGSLCHVSWVCAKKLYAQRPFAVVEIKIFAGAFVAPKDAFSRNEFGDKNIGAIAFADLAKNLVGDASHRREIEREAVFEPGKTGVHRPLFFHEMPGNTGGLK